MLSKTHRWSMFFISAVFFLYEFVLRVSPGAMTNELRESFHINAQSLGFMGSIFFQAYAWMQIPVGLLFDRFSTRKILSLACLLCAVGTFLFASSQLFWIAVLGRCIIGIGASFGFVGALKVAEHWLPIKNFSFISGLLFTLGFLGAGMSDNLLSALLKFQTWEISFFYIAASGVLLSILIYFIFRDSPEHRHEQKKLSTKKLIHGLVCIMKNPYIWINGVIGFLMYFPTSAFAELWGKSYLESVLHFNSQQAVFAIGLVFIGWAVGGPLFGWLSDRSNDRKLFLCLGSFAAALCISMILFFPIFDYFTVCFLLLLFGIFSAAEVLNFVYSMEISAKGFSGTAIATTNMIVVLGGACSQPIVGWFLDHNWSGLLSETGIRLYSVNDYKSSFIILPATLIISGILSLFLKEKIQEQLE